MCRLLCFMWEYLMNVPRSERLLVTRSTKCFLNMLDHLHTVFSTDCLKGLRSTLNQPQNTLDSSISSISR